MSIQLTELNQYFNHLLRPHRFDDYCPNGLQVEGAETVHSIVTGVTASQQLIDIAIEKKADAVLVHHGYFWKGEPQSITGIKRKRIKSLLANNINLFAYHLPLDAHLELGNNVQLAKKLGWEPEAVEKKYPLPMIRTAQLADTMSGAELVEHLHQKLCRVPQHIEADRKIKKVAWCTGAAQSYFAEAITMGVDAFISGEISETTTHIARENNVHYFAAGHHATERYGVKALGEYVASELDVSVEFVDCDNPV